MTFCSGKTPSNYKSYRKFLCSLNCRVGWRCRIHQLLLCRGIRTPPPKECPGYDTKKSDGELQVKLQRWGMQSTHSLSSLPSSLWSGIITPDRVLSICQIELKCVLMLNQTAWNRTALTFKLRTYAKLNRTVLYAKLICLKWNCFWHWNCT